MEEHYNYGEKQSVENIERIAFEMLRDLSVEKGGTPNLVPSFKEITVKSVV